MFIVLGTVTADIFVRAGAVSGETDSDGFTSENLLFTQEPVQIAMGGNGGNSAYVLAGLGARTALCGAVGRDLLGDTLVDWLNKRKIDLAGLLRSTSHATSSSTILMRDFESQVVYHHVGSSAAADFAQMPADLFAQADVLLAASFPILAKLRAGGFAQALERVRMAGGITALDIGPAIGPPVRSEELLPILPLTDYFIANNHELLMLSAGSEQEDAVASLLDAGARHVVVKRGDQGVSCWSAAGRIDVPAFAVKANISVGAGDAFNAGLLFRLQQGGPLEQALRFANAVAALVVSSKRGILDAPTLSEVEALLRTA